jgi:hypothetical protein
MRPEGLGQFKKIHLIGTLTRELPALQHRALTTITIIYLLKLSVYLRAVLWTNVKTNKRKKRSNHIHTNNSKRGDSYHLYNNINNNSVRTIMLSL